MDMEVSEDILALSVGSVKRRYSRGARGSEWTPRALLVALSFSKLQTFLNNIPEGNPLKSVYLTPKIAFTFRPMWSLNGRVAYISLSKFTQYIYNNKRKCSII